MIARRDLLIGAAAAGAAGLALALKPRRHVSLLGKIKLENVVPESFPGWSAEASQGLVKPKPQGLAAELYNEEVQRVYYNPDTETAVMVLIAYGGTQSDTLQLHRPEVCYPAIGFAIQSKAPGLLPLPGGTGLPLVRLVAVAGEREENILYWTRVGEALPTNGESQRSILVKDAMRGFVPDGVLVRCSTINIDHAAAFKVLDAFVPAFLKAVGASGRPALVGTDLAKALSSA